MSLLSGLFGRAPLEAHQGHNDYGDYAWNAFKPRSMLFGPRFQLLDWRSSFYRCSQHNAKTFDFEGRVITQSNGLGMPTMFMAAKTNDYIYMGDRRPSNPIRIGKSIVEAFTDFVFAEGTFPTLSVDDEKSQYFVEQVVKSSKLPYMMIQARNEGGSTGTVGISWCFRNGLPKFRVHSAKNLFVHKWLDREELLPEWVTEVYTFHKTQWDGKQFARVIYWQRRDWTPNADVVFEPVVFIPGKEPTWTIDEERSVRHDDGVVHFEWVQNLPNIEEADGLPDYEGTYEQMNELDVLNSVVSKGGKLNLDPTLVLQMDPDLINIAGVKKGSDNSIVAGESGNAQYLELGGQSLIAGMQLVKDQRQQILDTCKCILLDPNTAAANGTSSVAMKVIYAPMLARCNVLREQYGTAIERMLEKMLKVAQARASVPTKVVINGEEREATQALALPPRKIETPVLDMEGNPVEDEEGKPKVNVKYEPCVPGEQTDITLAWPQYFPATAADQTALSTTLTAATGGKSYLSRKTAIEFFSRSLGVDPVEEAKRVEEQAHQQAQEQSAMFPGIGGAVEGEELPEGATPKPQFGGRGGKGFPPKGGDSSNEVEKDDTEQKDEPKKPNPFAKKP